MASNSSLFSLVKSFFFVRDRFVGRWRDKKTGRFVSGKMYRTAFGIKQLPLNHKYYGVTFYAWSKEELLLQWSIDQLYEIFVEQFSKFLGYGESEWWFSVFEQKNFEMVLKKPKLLGTWRFKVDFKGVPIYKRKGKT